MPDDMQKKMKRKTTSRTTIRNRKPRSKVVRHRNTRDPQDEKLCLTKGQLCNIVIAAEKKKEACPKAKQFIRELKAEMKVKR